MDTHLIYTLIDYIPIFIIALGIGKMVETSYKMSKSAEQTLYLIDKVNDIERRIKIIDKKVNYLKGENHENIDQNQ